MSSPLPRFLPDLPAHVVDAAVRVALAEDLGLVGDLTSQATLPSDAVADARIVSRETGIIAGLPLAAAAFRLIGAGIRFEPMVADGWTTHPGDTIARVVGPAGLVLSAERIALNFLTHLSGIATLTRRYVDAIIGTGARICDTRKTLPGLRAVEKYAVRCGGGANHRFGLGDAVLIKDNHIAVAGGVTAVLAAAKANLGHLVAIEIEVDTLAQLEEALAAGARVVLLDNMDDETLRRAVAINAGRARLEASGGVRLDRVRAIAETGVDFISTSQITAAAPPLDLGLDIDIRT
ncbi:MAG: carboxylating nicotinate-nucleotide diphosphorylase [Devosia sp.]|nr:carboxylating nicotinate-nucleotide diphosphorylase [Devosia sp.]